MFADRPDSSGSGRIRLGVNIAAASLKTMVRNRHLLVFSFLSGLAMFFLIVAKVWDVQQFDETLPLLILGDTLKKPSRYNKHSGNFPSRGIIISGNAPSNPHL
jgi:hypothetical protein